MQSNDRYPAFRYSHSHAYYYYYYYYYLCDICTVNYLWMVESRGNNSRKLAYLAPLCPLNFVHAFIRKLSCRCAYTRCTVGRGWSRVYLCGWTGDMGYGPPWWQLLCFCRSIRILHCHKMLFGPDKSGRQYRIMVCPYLAFHFSFHFLLVLFLVSLSNISFRSLCLFYAFIAFVSVAATATFYMTHEY